MTTLEVRVLADPHQLPEGMTVEDFAEQLSEALLPRIGDPVVPRAVFRDACDIAQGLLAGPPAEVDVTGFRLPQNGGIRVIVAITVGKANPVTAVQAGALRSQ